jgi:succinate dehydrogenase / fumarate reductase, cytochrome b subunit
MKWSEFFSSSVGKKFVMALTGLFLISFLVVHVGINATIYATLFDDNDHGMMFNKAAHFMASTVVVRIMEIGLFAGIFLHIIQGYVLQAKNRSARNITYAVPMGSKGANWYSRSMGLLGTLILIFFILHWYQFWLPGRNLIGEVPPVTYDGKEMHDMFKLMQINFQPIWVVIVYVLACISLAYHLMHGFQSAFRTMGVINRRYITLVQSVGFGFAIIVPLVFALMPVSVHFGWVA